MAEKIGIVIQRYGLEINGGAEYHARLIAENLCNHFEIEIFTTTALDYVSWEHHYEKNRETINGIVVNRFRVQRPRDPIRFGKIQEAVLNSEHPFLDELDWMEEEGPLVPALLKALEKRTDEFDYFVFFSYRYYHSFHGVKRFSHKAILVPTAEHDEVIYLKLFKDLFRLPAAIIYNSHEEKQLINRLSGNESVPADIVGVGSEIPDRVDPHPVRSRYNLNQRYFLYIGRLDENKGIPELFTFFLRLQAEKNLALSLVLIGRSLIPVPSHPRIRHLGFLADEDKFALLSGTEFLVIPSQYESLSMVTLEAWALGKPVLANGRTEVLKGQCQRSNGGLWYENYDEFKESLLLLESLPKLRENLGENGRRYFQKNYSWEVIQAKYLRLIKLLDSRKSTTGVNQNNLNLK